jgi:hypothetical protein
MGGAIPGKDFLAIMREAGFAGVEMVSETGFNSSPVTKGVLFRAVKPALPISERRADLIATHLARKSLKEAEHAGTEGLSHEA